MNQAYQAVPNIITGKDLDYLKDMFEWNYGAYKNCMNCINEVQSTEIKQLLQKASSLFQNNMQQVLNILGGHNEQQ